MKARKTTQKAKPLTLLFKWTLPLAFFSIAFFLIARNTTHATTTLEAFIHRTAILAFLTAIGLSILSLGIVILRTVLKGTTTGEPFRPVPFAKKIFAKESTLQKEKEGWIYIMTNPSMPGICKVGYTDIDPQIRAKQLNNTSAASDFIVAWSMQTRWAHQIEQQTHRLLKSQGLHTKREFFRTNIAQVIANIEKAKHHIFQISTEHSS